MNEIWKPIDGYDEYEISSIGRVRSSKYGYIHFLAFMKNRKGYLRVKLSKNSKERLFLVHRLVADAFLNEKKGEQINHINGKKDDNRVENLEWCTASQNLKHAYDFLGRKAYLLGKHHSESTREKISSALSGKKRTEEQRIKNSLSHIGLGLLGKNPKARKTICVETGQVFSCAKEAAIHFGFNPSGVYQACHSGNRCRGFHFSYS